MSRVVALYPEMSAPPPVPDLTGHRVLITNASAGVGPVIAHTFAAFECRIALQCSDTAAVKTLAGELDEAMAVRVFPSSLPDASSARRLTNAAANAFSALDIVINQLDLARPDLYEAATADAAEKALATALRAQCSVCETAAAQMRRAGRGGLIVYTADLGTVPPGSGLAALMHVALSTLAATQARDWNQDGIRVNAIAATETRSDTALETLSALALHLAGPESPWLSGQTLTVRDAVLEA